MERLRAVATHYQQAHDKLPTSWRIDVVAVWIDQKGKPRRIELIENAVGEEQEFLPLPSKSAVLE